MSVEIADNVVIVRRGRGLLLPGLGMVMAGAAVGWYALTHADGHDDFSVYVGVVVGLTTALAGLILPLSVLDTLRIDGNARLVIDTTYNWRGRSVRIAPFADVASIGRDITKDPRDGLVWALHGLIRLNDGNDIKVADSTP